MQIKHGSPDARLLVEVALLGGFSAFDGGGISHNIPFSKSISLKDSLENWKYVDRLVGIYEENGIKINREISLHSLLHLFHQQFLTQYKF